MTLEYLVNQLFELSVGGFFNGEKVNKGWLHNYIRTMMKEPEKLAIPEKLVMEIALPDGWWLFTVERKANGEWDYWIPENREEERAFFSSWRRLK